MDMVNCKLDKTRKRATSQAYTEYSVPAISQLEAEAYHSAFNNLRTVSTNTVPGKYLIGWSKSLASS